MNTTKGITINLGSRTPFLTEEHNSGVRKMVTALNQVLQGNENGYVSMVRLEADGNCHIELACTSNCETMAAIAPTLKQFDFMTGGLDELFPPRISFRWYLAGKMDRETETSIDAYLDWVTPQQM